MFKKELMQLKQEIHKTLQRKNINLMMMMMKTDVVYTEKLYFYICSFACI